MALISRVVEGRGYKHDILFWLVLQMPFKEGKQVTEKFSYEIRLKMHPKFVPNICTLFVIILLFVIYIPVHVKRSWKLETGAPLSHGNNCS